MSKSTICKYPFNSIAIKEYNANGELISFWPCCMMGNQTLEEVEKGIHLKKKLPTLPGEKLNDLTPIDKACTVCWEMEDRGIQSFRERSFSRDDAVDEIVSAQKLEIIDMSINNKCNLRCRMCSPSASSLLAVDHKYFTDNNLMDELKGSAVRWAPAELGAFKLKTNKQWQWIINNTDKFNRLRLSGGEPFDNDDVLEFIDTAIANGTAKDITLEFHTNGTLLTDELIEKLSYFNNNLNFSIDGTDKVYEFIRYAGICLKNSTEIFKSRFYHDGLQCV
jgi:sulfatase maturation enzyme AslB (radical SAM superfamily)